MEKESKNSSRTTTAAAAPASRGVVPEPDFLLQWGNRKRPRCVKIRDETASPNRSDGQKRSTSRVNRRVVNKDNNKDHFPTPPLLPSFRKSESGGSEENNNRKSTSSPEKEDRFYPTRGSTVCEEKEKENGNGNGNNNGSNEEKLVLPRFYLSLSNKEKEEDFMAMKGCKLPQRPKKRSKFLQKCLLLMSPGAWLTDLSLERYEVREKKSSRKRRRGLKAMCMESDSE